MSEFGEDFGQKVDLTASIRNILRNYPEGTAILKELVQNADDAGARKISFCLDHRTHKVDNLPSKSLEQFQGPSLLIYNDAVFTAEDFQSIQRIGDSLKKSEDSRAKIGRFGIGFNAVYHWTDLPSFVSGSCLVMLDPQAKFLPNVNPSNPGKIIDFLKTPNILSTYPDQFLPYQGQYLSNWKKPFQGTLFRLPLRTSVQAQTSSLSTRALSCENARSLLSNLQLEASAMLLFLKNVDAIEISEVFEDGVPRMLFQCSIANMTNELRQKRAIISNKQQQENVLQSQTGCVIADYLLRLNCVNYTNVSSEIVGIVKASSSNNVPISYVETWEICNQLGGPEPNSIASHPDNALLRLIPWGGVAACVNTTNVLRGGTEQAITQGLAYCFLPLPIQTNLPVMVNGFFELSSNRRDVWQAGADMTGDGRTRAQWNLALMRDILASSYVRLLERLKESMGFCDTYQGLWPCNYISTIDSNGNKEKSVVASPWNEVVKHTLMRCKDKKLLFVCREIPARDPDGKVITAIGNSSTANYANRWIECKNALLLPTSSLPSSGSNSSSTSSFAVILNAEEQADLTTFLVSAQANLVICLESLRDTLIETGTCALIATPTVVRGLLRSYHNNLAVTSINKGLLHLHITLYKFLLHYCLLDVNLSANSRFSASSAKTQLSELNGLHILPMISNNVGMLTIYNETQLDAINQLIGMGFNATMVMATLKKCNFNVDSACEILTTSTPNNLEKSSEVFILADEEESIIFGLASSILINKKLIGVQEHEVITHATMQKFSNIKLFSPHVVPDLLKYILPSVCFDETEVACVALFKETVGKVTSQNASKLKELTGFVNEFWKYTSQRSEVLSSIVNNVAIIPTIEFRSLCTLSRLSNLLMISKGNQKLSSELVMILAQLKINIVEQSVMHDTSTIPKVFWDYVHSPTRSGVIASIDFMNRQSGKNNNASSNSGSTLSPMMSMLTSEQRDSIRVFIASSEPIKQLTEQECVMIRNMPIFCNHKIVEAISKSHLCIGTNTIKQSSRPFFALSEPLYIAPELFPDNCLRHENSNEFALLQHLGVKVVTRAEFFKTELLPNIESLFEKYPEQTQLTISSMLLEIKTLLVQDKDFVTYIRSIAFVPNGGTLDLNINQFVGVKLCRGEDLFDPTITELVSLLDARLFPATNFQTEDLLMVLRTHLGLQCSLNWNGVVQCAVSVQDMPNSSEWIEKKQLRGNSLLQFLDKNMNRLMERPVVASSKTNASSNNSAGGSFSLFGFTSSLFSNVLTNNNSTVNTNLQAESKDFSMEEYIDQLQHIGCLYV